MKHIAKLLFYTLSLTLLFSISGCENAKNENNVEIKEEIQEEETFGIEPYNWNDVPEEIRNQIMGAGCEYSPVNNENLYYMVNGCVKINGIYELLEEKNTYSPDFSKQVFENSRWVLTIIVQPNQSNEIKEQGMLTLRSKMKNGSASVEVLRFCGT